MPSALRCSLRWTARTVARLMPALTDAARADEADVPPLPEAVAPVAMPPVASTVRTTLAPARSDRRRRAAAAARRAREAGARSADGSGAGCPAAPDDTSWGVNDGPFVSSPTGLADGLARSRRALRR